MTFPTPKLSTLGCRLNAYESEAMRELATSSGLSDAVIINTCAVTAEAVRKSKQEVRKLHKENPNAKVIVTGCAAQIDPNSFAKMAEVDFVIGNSEKMAKETWGQFSENENTADIFRSFCENPVNVFETELLTTHYLMLLLNRGGDRPPKRAR